MLEAMATLILVIVGAVLIIFILGYGIYVTFYPLTKTVKGGFDALKEHTEEEKKGAEKKDAQPSPDDTRKAPKEEHTGAEKRKHKPKK